MATTTPGPTVDELADQRHRRELLAHCYRMTGSVHDADDLVQETYLRAWRAQDSFEGRSSVRTWLYRIATNACLTALEGRRRRPLPIGLGTEAADPGAELVEDREIPWLEPVPDAASIDADGDPAQAAVERESLRLAFVAALQHLPPRQRAMLLLREVLAWTAADIAEALDTTTAAVNSGLQRARAALDRLDLDGDTSTGTLTADQRALLARFEAAFERYDIDELVAVFSHDAVWEMPPFQGWYQGGADIARLISVHCPASGPGDMRMLPTAANGQPAFGLYMRADDGRHRAFQLQVLTVGEGTVTRVAAFFGSSHPSGTTLFARFGLPEVFDPA